MSLIPKGKTNKEIIAIDLDSTLNNLEYHWLIKTYNEEYKDNLTEEDMFCWDVEKYVKPECGEKIYNILERPNFFFSLDPKPRSQEVTKKLLEKYELFVVTAYSPITVVDKVNWLQKYFPHIDKNNIVFCNKKWIIDADFLIDDGPHNITDFNNYNRGTGVVFDRPWNRELGTGFLRVKDWTEVENYFLP